MIASLASTGARLTLVAMALVVSNLARAEVPQAWLALEPAASAATERVVIRLQQGQDFATGQSAEIAPRQIERFALLQGQHVADLSVTEIASSVTAPEFDQSGPYLVVLTRGVGTRELSAEQFADYLATSVPGGATPAELAVRRERQRLRHWDFAKAIGQVGSDTEGSLHHRVVGQQLELVLLQNPALLAAGDEQIVQVYLESRPLTAQRVTAEHVAADGHVMRIARDTDARGTVRMQFAEPGVWLLRTAYLRRCKACTDADWDSLSASYTFSVPAAAAR